MVGREGFEPSKAEPADLQSALVDHLSTDPQMLGDYSENGVEGKCFFCYPSSTMSRFIIQGGEALKGEVRIGGSKNAVLPILAASLLSTAPVTLHNVPDISDVHTFLEIMETLGVKTAYKDGTVTIDTAGLKQAAIESGRVKHMRSSILLLGPLLGRFGEVQLAFPGGCVLGKRSVHAHLYALEALGAETVESTEDLHMKTSGLKAAKFIMAEASVTATSNALMAAVMADGVSEIRWAAMEPHVQDVCHFLVALGAKIEGIGTHTLTVHGGQALGGSEYTVTPDYIEAGTYALAGILTNGEIIIKNAPVGHLDSFWQKLEEVGANFTLGENEVQIHKHNGLHAVEKLQTAVFPGFPTDLQAPFVVLLTQCEGESKVYETLFEGRLNYLSELEKMGAEAQILNPHQAVIKGSTPLRAAEIVSCDIRAGAGMVLAALIAKGETVISGINYIDRGYERLEEKLRSLGAKIERSQS